MKRILTILLALGLALAAQHAQADWTSTKRLTWTSGDSYSPATAVDSSNAVHVVWADYSPGNSEIYHKRSEDGGTTWGTAKRLTWTSGDSYEPAIAIDSSDTLHVVWDSDSSGNYEIYYKRSSDGGLNWSAAKGLTGTSGWSEYPAITIDSNNVIHVVWQDDTPGNLEIYYRRSSDGGLNWSTAQRLTWTSGSSEYPAIAISSIHTIQVVWKDRTPGNYEIYYKQSTNGGTTWGPAKKLISTSGESHDPAIAIDSSNAIQVVWSDETPGNYEIYYKRSPDGGTTWGPLQRLTWTAGMSEYSAIAIGSDNIIHVIWDDDTPGNFEIYHKKSTDGGATWSAAQRLTWTAGSSLVAALAMDSSNSAHIVWEDNTYGNSEIFYKTGK